MRQIDTQVGLGGYGIEGVLQFDFMRVNWNVGVPEVFKAAGMVEMEMTHDHAFDVFDVVSCCSDCVGWDLAIYLIVEEEESQWSSTKPRNFELVRRLNGLVSLRVEFEIDYVDCFEKTYWQRVVHAGSCSSLSQRCHSKERSRLSGSLSHCRSRRGGVLRLDARLGL